MAFVSSGNMEDKLSVIGLVLNKDFETINRKRTVRTVPKVKNPLIDKIRGFYDLEAPDFIYCFSI
jgi:hypothetical protein